MRPISVAAASDRNAKRLAAIDEVRSSAVEPAPVIDVYDRHGAAWARSRARELNEGDWLNRFMTMLAPGASVLDVGCGSGVPIAAELVRRGFAVTGIDGSATMVTLFRRNLPHAIVRHSDMRTLQGVGCFSGLLAWDSLFHLSPEDQRPMFDRLGDHAADGAPLLFTSGPDEGCAIGDLEGEALYHGSLSPGDYRGLLDAAGFDTLAHAERDEGCGGRTVWLGRKRGGES